jgi:hypothetical protein
LNQPNNIRDMYVDVCKGSAFRYNKEMNQRYEYIKNCNTDTCSLERIKNTPHSIFYGDMSTDKNYWINQHTATFFDKKALALKKE